MESPVSNGSRSYPGPVGTEVFVWNSEGQVVYGEVESWSYLPDRDVSGDNIH